MATGPSRLGDLVDTAGPRRRARFPRDSWSNLRALLHRPEFPCHLVTTGRHETRAPFARKSRSTPRGIGPKRDMPRTDGRHRVHSDRKMRLLGELDTLQALGPMCKWPGSAARTCRPSGTGPSHPEYLVDPTGLQTQARFARESWSKPRALAKGPESRGTAGRKRGPSDLGPNRPRELVDTVVNQTQARFAWESWSKPRALGHGPESRGTDGRKRGLLDLGPTRPRELVDTTGHQTQA